MKKLFAFVGLVVLAWYFIHDPAADWRGTPATQDPIQDVSKLPRPFVHDGYTVTPLANYQVKAVVLSRSRYRNDRNAQLSPLDLALGWGPMSISGVLNELSISQSGRWYSYHWSDDPPLAPASIAQHSANTHCLPATAEIRDRLLAVKRHDLVSLSGYLVEVTATNGYRWRSSLTRDDQGGGACEVLWVTDLSRQKL